MMQKFKVPNTFVLIFSFIVLMAMLTWIMPGGEYQRHEKDGRTVIIAESFQKIAHQPQGLGSVLMSPLRGFVEAAKKAGFSYEELIRKILESALERYPDLRRNLYPNYF